MGIGAKADRLAAKLTESLEDIGIQRRGVAVALTVCICIYLKGLAFLRKEFEDRVKNIGELGVFDVSGAVLHRHDGCV